jgi:hypothetical protein
MVLGILRGRKLGAMRAEVAGMVGRVCIEPIKMRFGRVTNPRSSGLNTLG